jgi:hypothetical protein
MQAKPMQAKPMQANRKSSNAKMFRFDPNAVRMTSTAWSQILAKKSFRFSMEFLPPTGKKWEPRRGKRQKKLWVDPFSVAIRMARLASDQKTTARTSGSPPGTLRVERTDSLSGKLSGAEANFPQSF